jgi:hypothetical protein
MRWLQWPLRLAWRWVTGKPLNGVPRTDATWMADGTTELDPQTAPRPPALVFQEIRGDIAQIREELELRRRARRAVAEHERDSDPR